MCNKGMVHIYTGDGKGKTTAALGLALRAVGSGKKVFIAQFVKGMHYSELDALKKHANIVIQQFGRDCFIEKAPVTEDILAAQKGLEEVKILIKSSSYNMIILDEIFIALYYKLINAVDVKELIKQKNANLELILTGRNAPEEFFELADLVTEMKNVKHYYDKGVEARLGIEY